MSDKSNRPFGSTLSALSFLRVALAIVFLILFKKEDSINLFLCVIIIIVVQISDHLDGFIARRFSSPNIKGYVQDSVSDKLFHLAAFIAIQREFFLPIIILWLIMARDLTLFAYRSINPELAYGIKNNKNMTYLHAGILRVTIFLFCLDATSMEIYFYSHYSLIQEILYYLSGIISLILLLKLFKEIFIE